MLNNGGIRYIPETTGIVEYGTVAIHDCDERFFLGGASNRTCTGDVFSTTGRWTHNAPICSGINTSP